jgi:hypothetical protein
MVCELYLNKSIRKEKGREGKLFLQKQEGKFKLAGIKFTL